MIDKTKSVQFPPEDGRSRSHRLDLISVSVEKFEPEKVAATEKSTCSVRQLIERYTFTLGYDSGTLIGTVVTLLTKGKIRVEFRSFSERLSLSHMTDLMGQSEAIDLYASFNAFKPEEPKTPSTVYTQKLMVQIPKGQVPHYTNPRK